VRRLATSSVGMVLVLVVMVACGEKSAPTNAAPVRSTSACPHRDLNARIKTLEKFKETSTVAPGGIPVLNADTSAYPSTPQEVDAGGEYTFLFGPLRSDYPVTPKAIAFDYPCDFPGAIRRTGSISLIKDSDGLRFIKATFTIEGQFPKSTPIIIAY
jgi:hypothetical protein